MGRRHLRILYLPPGSSQYVLARSRSSVPISHLHHHYNGSHSLMVSHFATVSLKTCVDTIYESSPELFRDHNLDHSLYLLDPLESPTPVPSSSSSVASSPPGVAVGMGLFSTIRRSGDQRVITGTLMKDRTGLDTLEVIFMLKEAASMRKPPPEPDHDAETNARIAAALARQQNEQRMINQRARKVPGREGSPANQGLRQSGIASSSLKGKERAIESKPFAYQPFPSVASSATLPASRASSPSALPTPPSSQPTSHESTPDIEQLLSTVSHDPSTRAQTLLAIISMIDAPDSSADPKLVTYLKEYAMKNGLLSTSSPPRPQTPLQTPRPPAASRMPSSPDDEVIVLDKENVNPTAFRRRAEREREEAKQIALGIGGPNSAPIPSRPAQGLSQSVRSNTTLSNDPIPPAATSSTNTMSSGRKRTLSDCLGSPQRDRGRTVRSSRGRSERSSSRSRTNIPDPHRHYSTRVAVSGDVWTSPPRSRRNNENSSPGLGHGGSIRRPIVIPDSPSTPRMAASSPVRGTKTQLRRKPYVVPQWARTETATQPRLSEETLRAIERRQQEQKEKKKQKQKKTSALHRTISGPAVFSSPTASTSQTVSQPRPPPPIAASADPSMLMPVFAMPVNPIPLSTTSLSSPTRSRTPSPDNPPAPPCTPPRKRARSYSGSLSPGDMGESSLFTPLAATPLGRRPVLPGSPLVATPLGGKGPALPGSPLAFKSPAVSRQARDKASGDANVVVSPLVSPSNLGNTGSTESDDELERELDGVLSEMGDELECSSSTLAVASSDFDVPEGGETEMGDSDSESDEEESQSYPKRQFWQGLPPSSPPLPSSPVLSPQDWVPSSDRELPISSDDDFPEEGERESRSEMEDRSSTTDSGASLSHLDDNQQHEIAGYDMLTELGAVPSMGYTEGMDASFQDLDQDWSSFCGSVNIDLDELVRAVGPLLHSQTTGDGVEESVSTLGDDELAKTSQDIQNLLSGCLV